jgi:hypothetical protein
MSTMQKTKTCVRSQRGGLLAVPQSKAHLSWISRYGGPARHRREQCCSPKIPALCGKFNVKIQTQIPAPTTKVSSSHAHPPSCRRNTPVCGHTHVQSSQRPLLLQLRSGDTQAV